MNILVTGSKGFIGKNLVENFKNIRDGKSNICNIKIDKIYEVDTDTTMHMLNEYCKDADFVFNFAGINRPKKQEDFIHGNVEFATMLLNILKKNKNTAPIMHASSIQATLIGRYAESEYGKSKLASEELFFNYSKENKVKVLIYRLPNLFGKWCRPNYNSVVATFCNAIAKGLEYTVSDPSIELELLYIDDLILEMFDVLMGQEHYCDYYGITPIENSKGQYCYAKNTYKVTLQRILDLLHTFEYYPRSLIMPLIPKNSFEKKLYSTYLSYLPKEKMIFPLQMNSDDRGTFTELLKVPSYGQISVNISKPGVVKGQHWHNSKWEMFIVISGHGLIQERMIGSDEIIEFEVHGNKIEAVYMLPGYTHNIINLSDTEDLVTIMWANEIFEIDKPDTFSEIV